MIGAKFTGVVNWSHFCTLEDFILVARQQDILWDGEVVPIHPAIKRSARI